MNQKAPHAGGSASPRQEVASRRKPLHRPVPDSFQIVIQCTSEAEQERLYHELRARGLTVKVLTM